MSKKEFEQILNGEYKNISYNPLWKTAVNLASNVTLHNCELTQRGLELLCSAILEKDKEIHCAKNST